VYHALLYVVIVGFLFQLPVAFSAGNRALRLVFLTDAPSMRKASKRLRSRIVLLVAAALVSTCASAVLAARFSPLLWQDWLPFALAFALLPALLLLAAAWPRLAALSVTARSAGSRELSAEERRPSASHWLTFPFRLSALGALAGLYLMLVRPDPWRWSESAIPLAFLAAAVAAAWFIHANRAHLFAISGPPPAHQRKRERLTRLAVIAAAAAAAVPLVMAASAGSRLPADMDMTSGAADYGGAAPASGHAHHAAAAAASVPVTELAGERTERPDRRITLTAVKKQVALSSGRTVDAWTYNGQIPGPELRFKEGETVEVTLRNADIEEGVTIHWHGLDVPNAEDGVAGVTQDAVMPGESHVYRFRAEQTGSFWYHSHQHSREAVVKGLFGALVVEPRDPEPQHTLDLPLVTHNWEDAGLAVNSWDELRRMAVPAGTKIRLRLVNTDDWVRQTYELIGSPFRVTAIDGTELHEPGELENVRLGLITGARYDIVFTMPDRTVFLRVGGSDDKGLLMSPDGQGDVPEASPGPMFRPENYGRPAAAPFGPDSDFDRSFTMILDDKLGFFDGRFGGYQTINGRLFPDTPMFVVREGELIKTTIVNRSAVDHPMHLHGHHVLVLSRNGKPVTGSPWWSDTLDVAPGEWYEVAFRADNPGIWMDHCHNLVHAANGMTMHLMYEGVSTPFSVGASSGNHPE